MTRVTIMENTGYQRGAIETMGAVSRRKGTWMNVTATNASNLVQYYYYQLHHPSYASHQFSPYSQYFHRY
jgi:hypothetical protein